MAVEVNGFETVQGPGEVFSAAENSTVHSKENGDFDQANGLKETIKFDIHEDETINKEGNDVSAGNLPKNAVEEWPAVKQIYSFFFVRHRSYDDPNIKTKIDLADKEIQSRNESRFQIKEALQAKRLVRAELISQIKSLKENNRQIKTLVDGKMKEIEPLQDALDKFRNASNAGRGSGLCSSEEELNAIIHSMQYRMQHESIPLSEEKQILREIKQLEGTREKVISNAAIRAQVQDSIVEKETLQDQVKVIGGDLSGVRKQQQEVRAKIKQIDDSLNVIDGEIKSLQDELIAVTEKRDKCFETIKHLRQKRDESNSNFYESRKIMAKARELAASKDIKGIEELSYAEEEKFMSLWNSNKAFRDDYESRILKSLDSRQLSRDGRMRNPDEKPLVDIKTSPSIPPSETISAPKENSNQNNNDLKSLPVDMTLARAPKIKKDVKKKVSESKPKNEQIEAPEAEFFVSEKPKSIIEIDPVKLKEMKRKEEIAKAKLAFERKKKLSEKAAAKAAIRAQKEEEKKLKEREKKAKKKAKPYGPATEPKEQVVTAEETAVPEMINEKIESRALENEKIQKDNSKVRMKNRSKGLDSIPLKAVPKAILKRKKSNNYWEWAVPGAVLLMTIMIAVLGYNYVL